MKRKFTILCSFIVALSICIAMLGVTGNEIKNDATTAAMETYGAPKAEGTTSSGWGDIVNDVVGGIGSGSSGDLEDILGGVDTDSISDAVSGFGDSLGGMGDAIGGIGDAFGGIADGIGSAMDGIFGGGLGGFGSSGTTVSTNTTAPESTTSADVGLIIPVPAATQSPAETVIVTVYVEASQTGETVDYAATSNPYTKPTGTFVAGDEDETIKWLQWIFVYTGYGLNENGITGVLDEDTVSVVKKLQKENELTVDGSINEDVIKAAEVLYYQSVLGGSNVNAIELPSDATTGENTSNQTAATDDGNGISVALLIIILVIIWVLAIGGIVILFIFKKKKMNAAKNASAEKAESKAADAGKKENNGKNEIKSLSDLFEEAENKDK